MKRVMTPGRKPALGAGLCSYLKANANELLALPRILFRRRRRIKKLFLLLLGFPFVDLRKAWQT